MSQPDQEVSTETHDSELSRREMLSRLKVVAYLVPGLGAVVATVGSNGCGPAQAPTIPTSTVPAPTATPAATPTATASVWDGTYGPAVFTRGEDTCAPPFFGSSYNGTVIISQNGTRCSIGESQTRLSTGSGITNDSASYVGEGNVGSARATWNVSIQFQVVGTVRSARVTETLRLTDRNNCGTAYNGQVQRVGNAPIQP